MKCTHLGSTLIITPHPSQIRALLSTIFKFAISRKYLSNNPVNDTEIALKIEDKNKQREQVENKYLERDEAEKIISYLANKKRCLLHSRMSEFLWLTGLRYGELQALKWNNYHDGSIRVEGTLDSFMRSIQKQKKHRLRLLPVSVSLTCQIGL